MIPFAAIESFAAFDSNIYDPSSYENGYEILRQNGEGIALEAPNPEAEESTFCLSNTMTQPATLRLALWLLRSED